MPLCPKCGLIVSDNPQVTPQLSEVSNTSGNKGLPG